MNILEKLNISDIISILLIFLLPVMLLILFVLVKKNIKRELKLIKEELYNRIEKEINRLAGEIVSSQYRSGFEEKLINKQEIEQNASDENYNSELQKLEKTKILSKESHHGNNNSNFNIQSPYQDNDFSFHSNSEPLEYNSSSEDNFDSWVKEYNLAINNEENQNSFNNKYRPVRVDVVNALERRRKANLEPIYQTAYNGDYYVITIQEDEQTLHAVLPRFNLMIKESNFKAGAFGDIFECLHYENGSFHRVNKVIKSAFFAKKRHEYWELISKGKIELAFEE